MKRFITLTTILAAFLCSCSPKEQTIDFGNGTLTLSALQDDAIRIRYSEGEVREMPEMVYEQTEAKISLKKTFTA